MAVDKTKFVRGNNLAATDFDFDDAGNFISVKTDATSSVGIAIAAAAGGSVPDASATEAGIVNLTSLQVLGAGDKVINGVRAGKGAQTGAGNTVLSANGLGAVNAGSDNTVIGNNSGKTLAGNSNVIAGTNAAPTATTAYANVVVGDYAGNKLTTPFAVVLVGANAGAKLTSQMNVTAVGTDALTNSTSNSETAVGAGAQRDATTSTGNTAVGRLAMAGNQTANNRVAIGEEALSARGAGDNITAVGKHSLRQLKASDTLTALGYKAGDNLINENYTNSTCIGANSTLTKSNQVVLGDTAVVETVIHGALVVGETSTVAGSAGTAGQVLTSAGPSAAPVWAAAGGGGGSVPDASATEAGIVNLTSLQVLGAGDKVINGVRVGRGGGNKSTNTANGNAALYSNTTGGYNTANGSYALYSNTTGGNNTANGNSALANNTTGGYNTANGSAALSSNTEGGSNTASGNSALSSNTTGDANTATGNSALKANTTGISNTANGAAALYSNTTGKYNTASGDSALYYNTTGNSNTALGSQQNTSGAYAPAFNCTTENNRVSIAHTGVTNAYINVAWTVVSDERDKEILGEVPLGLAFINKLSTISYRMKQNRTDAQGEGPVRYGFSAQKTLAAELELTGKAVVVDNEDADKLRFNDQAIIAALTNAVNELTARIATLESKV